MGELLDRLSPEEGFLLNRFFTGVQKDFSPEELEKIQSLQAKNATMVDSYLGELDFDVYFASSIRKKENWFEAERICQKLEKALNAKIVMPSSFFVESGSVEQKGDIERWLIEKAKCVFVLAGQSDTWGKDAETLEALLFYKKPAVMLASDESDGSFPSRYKIAHDVHPKKVVGNWFLGLGLHIVKTEEEAIECLRRILTNTTLTVIKGRDGAFEERCLKCNSLLRRSDPSWLKKSLPADVKSNIPREGVEKIVYIVSRLTAKSKIKFRENQKIAKQACRIVALKGWLPIAGHIYFDEFLSDFIPEERKRCLLFDKNLLMRLADEVFVIGKIRKGGKKEGPSGMEQEISLARFFSRKIRYFKNLDELCEKLHIPLKELQNLP